MGLHRSPRDVWASAVPYCANWRNPAEYPDLKTATPEVWAWAFLRRNPKYCRAYAGLAYWRDAAEAAETADPALAEKARRRVSRRSRAISRGFRLSLLGGAVDPRGSALPGFLVGSVRVLDWIDGPPTLAKTVAVRGQGRISPRAPHEALFALDLRMPFEREMARIADRFRGMQAHKAEYGAIALIKFKARPEHYLRYLRLLDAESAGAARDVIKRLLYADRETTKSAVMSADDAVADDWHVRAGAARRRAKATTVRHALSNDMKAARQLRDEFYLQIAAAWWPKGKGGDA